MENSAHQSDLFLSQELTEIENSMKQEELNWKNALKSEKQKDYFKKIISHINNERTQGKTIYPKNSDIFNALTFTELADVKVVILGQDPYHGPNQAHGLCFSVQHGVPAPPSLVNIFKELNNDLGIPIPGHGCLETWAKSGVLLLNTVLSVERGKAHSHANMGWERFTDKVIACVNNRLDSVVFLLWGSHAQKKGAIIDRRKHHVLTAPHPSPLSAHRGFLGCKHFSKANELLKQAGKKPIDWSLPSN